jgi:hypothetical protein
MISMTKTLGLFVEPTGLENGVIYIEDLQFFKYVGTIDAVSGHPMDPGSIHEGKVETIYYYYDPLQEYESIDDIEYLYKDY